MSYQRFLDALHPDDREMADLATKEALDNHRDYDTEYRSLWPDGSLHWLEAKGRGFYDATGSATRMEGVVLDITGRKQVEEALRESRETLNAALASMTDAVFISDTRGHFVEFNDAFAMFHRFKNKAECGSKLTDFHAILDVFMANGELAPLDMWAVPRALRGETVTNAEYFLRRKDTGETWVGNYSFGPIRDKDGVIVGSVVVGRDITGQKRAAEALAASETRYRGLFESARDGILIIEAETGMVLDVNPFLIGLLGFSHEQFLGKKIWELGFFKDLVANQDNFAELQRKEYLRYDDLALETSDGRRIPVEFISSVSLVNHREVIQCSIRDITERKRAEEAMLQSRQAALNLMTDAVAARDRSEGMSRALRASEENYRTLFREMQNGFAHSEIICDAQGRPVDSRYLAVNPAFERITGRKAEEVVGKSILEVFPALEPGWLETFGRVALSGEPAHFEMSAAELGVTFDVSAFRPAPNQYACTFSDITARKRAEAEIRELNRSLEQRVQERTAELLAANEELSAFAYAVSHDLRAPLRAMNGFSQALLEDHGATLRDAAREYLDEIILASRRMGELIDGLLRLSRSTRGELRRDAVDLSALALRLLGELAAAEPQRRVTWTVEPGLTARGDWHMIEAVLANLLDNAWKYTAHRAEAKIEVGAQGSGLRVQDADFGDPKGDLATMARPETRNLHTETFCIRDNGAGFDMKHAARLFQAFQRLHRQDEFPGIGIGLATVQRIVHRHGGTIWATAAPGQGATFCFSLPVLDVNDEEKP